MRAFYIKVKESFLAFPVPAVPAKLAGLFTAVRADKRGRAVPAEQAKRAVPAMPGAKLAGLFTAFLFVFVSCGYTNMEWGAQQSKCNFRVDRGFVVKWGELPIPVYIHESMSTLARKNFLYAMDMWNESWNYYTGTGRLFELIGEVQMNYSLNRDVDGDGVNIVFLDKRHRMLDSHQQGTTHIRNYFGGAIYDADIVMNNVDYIYYYEKEDFDYSEYTQVPELSTARSLASTTPRSFWKRFLYAFQSFLDFLTFWKKKEPRGLARDSHISKREVDFISLSLHELGHLGAMVHIEGQPSIMNPELGRGQIRRDIREIELSKLACGYGYGK